MLIFIESKTFTNVVDQVEKWYGGEFTVESLEKSFLNDLANRESNPKFAIPGPNIFMPDNFEIEKLETGENDDLGQFIRFLISDYVSFRKSKIYQPLARF